MRGSWNMHGARYVSYIIRKIFPGCQQMAKVPNGLETLPKISIAEVGFTNVTDRQTDERHTATFVHVR